MDHQSFRLDARILRLTIWRALVQAGVSQPGEGAEEHFRGRETATDAPAPNIEVAPVRRDAAKVRSTRMSVNPDVRRRHAAAEAHRWS